MIAVETCDVIVVGVGGMGSAACLELARRGLSVVGLEQFAIGHDRGSSHGHTRITRQAYFEHADYVPLLQRTCELWAQIEDQAGRRLQEHCGVLLAGPADGVVIPGVRRAAESHGLHIESIEPAELAPRFPGFAVPPDHAVIFEPHAGILYVERCVAVLAELATRHGADLRSDSPVHAIEPGPHSVEVRCGSQRLQAGHVLLTAGPWTAGLVGDEVGPKLEVLRKVQLWYDVPQPVYALGHGCPVFGFETDDGDFVYGMPAIPGRGLKAGEHSGREVVADPAQLDRRLRPAERRRVERLLAPHLPDADWKLASHSVCMYTMSPDGHFIVGRHPQHDRVVVAAGFSGHGFKFAPVMGEVLADEVIAGSSRHPLAFLGFDRPGLRSPAADPPQNPR